MGIDRPNIPIDEVVMNREVDVMDLSEKKRYWDIARIYFQRELFKYWVKTKKHSDVEEMHGERGQRLLSGLEKSEFPIIGKAFAEVVDNDHTSSELKDEIIEEYFRWVKVHKNEPNSEDEVFGQDLVARVFEKISK